MFDSIKKILTGNKNTIKDEKIESKYELETYNNKRLLTLMSYASGLLPLQAGCSSLNVDRGPVFVLIKALTDKIMLENAFELLTTNNSSFETYMFKDMVKTWYSDDKCYISRYIFDRTVRCDVHIDLIHDPILPLPWTGEDLIGALNVIGTEDNPWKEDILNHAVCLWLPIGISFVHGGNHSIFSGVMKREGVIHINPNGITKRNYAIDMSILYEKIFFDGTYYKRIDDKSILGEAFSFEFGCIFEIGRLLWKNGICFKNIKLNEYETKKENS